MKSFKVKIVDSGNVSWYRHYLHFIFDVYEVPRRPRRYVVADTPHNRSLLTKKEHLSRIDGTHRFGLRLGIAKQHAQAINTDSNKGASKLLVLKEESL